jgi:hypothetical protein
LNPEADEKLRTGKAIADVDVSQNATTDTSCLFELGARTGRADVVEGDGSSAEKDKGEGKGGESHSEAVSVISDQPVVRGYLPDRDTHIDANSESGCASEQAEQHEQTSEELGEGRKIPAPCGQTEAADELNVMVQSAENLVIAEVDHDCAESEAHDEKSERLQTIQKAQTSSSGRRQHRLQQLREGREGSEVLGCDAVSLTRWAG